MGKIILEKPSWFEKNCEKYYNNFIEKMERLYQGKDSVEFNSFEELMNEAKKDPYGAYFHPHFPPRDEVTELPYPITEGRLFTSYGPTMPSQKLPSSPLGQDDIGHSSGTCIGDVRWVK